MSREVKIAAVQLPNLRELTSATLGRETNINLAEGWLEKAGQQGADIACLAEMLTTEGVQLNAKNFLEAIEQSPDALVERLGAIARRYRMHIIVPALCRIDGIPRNAAFLLDRTGKLVGAYRKVHCTENERDLGILPGDDWPVFRLDIGSIGIQICHDNSFPESARCLGLNGAEIIFWPHVMSGWGDEFMNVLMVAPAVHNGIFHVPVCYGCHPNQAWMPGMMIGHSSIIRPDGTTVADAGRNAGIALAEVDLDALRLASGFTRDGDHAFRVDMLNDRRPDTYEPLIRPRERIQPYTPKE